jgi:ribonuclease D
VAEALTVGQADAEIADLAARARAAGQLGIDTEFMSEGRYQALLCLVQVAVPDPDAAGGNRVGLIDPLEGVDPTPLAEVLANPEVEVVVHAGRQDVAILRRTWDVDPTNLFDTQIAAGFAGFSAQAGYGTLLAELLDVHLAKSAGFTRWDLRPLTTEQVGYARDDVLHILPLADALRERLRASRRLDWARQECTRLEQASDQRDPLTAWERLPRVHQLSGRARAVAKELAAWRERTAAAEDRPVGSVLGDAPLLELARRQPTEAGALDRIRGLQPSTVRRRGQELLAMIAKGVKEPPPSIDGPERLDLRPTDAPLIALAEALVRARALDAGLAYELLASRSDLEHVISSARRKTAQPTVRTLQGWRRELVGAELLELLAGGRQLSVDRSGRLVVESDHGREERRPG